MVDRLEDLGKGYVEFIDQLNKQRGVGPLVKKTRRKNGKKRKKNKR